MAANDPVHDLRADAKAAGNGDLLLARANASANGVRLLVSQRAVGGDGRASALGRAVAVVVEVSAREQVVWSDAGRDVAAVENKGGWKPTEGKKERHSVRPDHGPGAEQPVAVAVPSTRPEPAALASLNLVPESGNRPRFGSADALDYEANRGLVEPYGPGKLFLCPLARSIGFSDPGAVNGLLGGHVGQDTAVGAGVKGVDREKVVGQDGGMGYGSGHKIKMRCLECRATWLEGVYRLATRRGARPRCVGCGALAIEPASEAERLALTRAQARKSDAQFQNRRHKHGPVARAIGAEEFELILKDERIPEDVRTALREKRELHRKARSEKDAGIK